jgi:predicted RNA binding protein YcfA (HicA-like mRNA interferase family)
MVKFKLFVEFLLSIGCIFDRIVGDHHIYTKEGLKRPVVIVQEKEISIHIIKSNLRTLGIDTKEFYSYLDNLKKKNRKK